MKRAFFMLASMAGRRTRWHPIGWRITTWVGLLGVSALVSGCADLGYYAQSVGGHLQLMQAARPVSVWLSDDHLACAAPMFELRELYAAAGLKATDWRRRFDDHVVLQLHYLRQVFLAPSFPADDTARFIDEHLGYWFPDFAQRVSLQCNTAFYAALAELTHVWLVRLRELLDEIHDLPIPSREEMSQFINRKFVLDKAEVAPIKFMPGAQGASW